MKPEHEPNENETDLVKEEAPTPIKYGISGLSDVVLVVEGQEFHVNKQVSCYIYLHIHSFEGSRLPFYLI